MTITSEAELDNLMTEAMAAIHLAYARVPSSTLREEPDSVAYESAIDFPVFNASILQRFAVEDADRRIGEVRDAFKGRPFSWNVLPGATPTDLDERLSKSGATFIVTLQGMIMETESLPNAPEPPVSTRLVRAQTPQTVTDYAHVFPVLFGAPTEGWIHQVVEAELALYNSGEDPFHRWVAYEDDTPVAAAMTMKVGDLAVLQTLSTLERVRNRGIGHAIATHALQAERDAGCTKAAVWSSPGAQTLYKRIGFQPCRTANIYLG
jgi:GNAT superfamily N-acetyltransferase